MSSANVYALLVGINKYKNVTGLNGCVADIAAVQEFLENRLDRETYDLHELLLNDEAATRDAIINEFKQHLSKAGKGDVVLFYFCGHGAREAVGEEFKNWELDNAHETIVCYDSRSETDGKRVPDLADKELRYLISEVANQGDNSPAHILVVFDCCHSSSGTRTLDDTEGIRQIDDKAPARGYGDFCFGNDILSDQLSSETFPQGDHTFIAACLNTETAKEIPQKMSAVRGLFTYSFIKELESQNAALSYENLIQEVRTRVTGARLSQTPQLEFIKGDNPLSSSKISSDLAFLGNPAIIKPRDPSFTLKYRPHCVATTSDPEQQAEWIVDAGAFQGLQADTELAVYPEGSKYEELEIKKQGTEEIVKAGSVKEIAQIKITRVRATESVVAFMPETPTPDNNQLFPAIIIKRPVPKVVFYFDEKDADRELLGKVKKKLAEWQSLAVGVTNDRQQAHQYRLCIDQQKFEIRDGIDNRLLVEPFAAEDNDFSIDLAASRVEHIARWVTTRDLENPNSAIDKNQVEIEVSYQEVISKEHHLVLYQQSEKPRIGVKISNKSGYRLFFTLLDICNDYSINDGGILYDGVNKETWLAIEDGTTYTAKYSSQGKLREDIPIGIPEKYEQFTEYGETLKLIASTYQFPVDGFKLNSLPIQPPGGDRDVGDDDREPPVGDWVTKRFDFTFIRSKSSVAIDPNTPTELSKGISIQLPDGFSTTASLKPVSTLSSERSLDRPVMELPLLKDAEAFDLIDRRSGDRGISQIPAQQLSVLELSGGNFDRVTPASPIVISSDRALQSNEGILALTHDGNFWLPVGYAMPQESGKTEIAIQHLIPQSSQESPEDERKISEAISLCFLKVALHNQQTAWIRTATPNLDRTVSFSPKGDIKAVERAVAQAEQIVLFVHGILGDTESMIPSMLDTKLLNLSGTHEPEKYDLVLAFDYESLNTKIEDTATILKNLLKQVGLGSGHNKTLHVIAHSMGGLVARTLIEQQGGNKEIVNHLIMLGTPNGGSEWSSVYQLVTLLLSAGLNFIPQSFVAGPFVFLLANQTIEKMSNSLKQMNARESEFLTELNRSQDPQCPYTIIAGDTSLERELKAKAEDLLQALVQKVLKGIEFPFKGQNNDIAVTQRSIFIQDVFAGRNPAVETIDPIACNHVTYFIDRQGLNALTQAVDLAFKRSRSQENG